MKKRVKRGRWLMASGLFLMLGSTFFRAIPSFSWTASTTAVFFGFGLMVVGLLMAHQ